MPALAKELADVIDKALVRNPKNRFPDAGKLLASLPEWPRLKDCTPHRSALIFAYENIR
jgi:hypothetical protein